MPLLALRSLTETPPGYWHFPRYPDKPIQNPQTDLIYGGDYYDLCSKVSNWRIINKLPLGNIEAEIQHFICTTTHAQCRPANPAKSIGGAARVDGHTVARFLSAMAMWMASGGHVEQEEADRRALICAGCKYRVNAPEACASCFGLAARVMRIIGGRKTRMDAVLDSKFCGVCGCAALAVAWVPIDILNRAHENGDFPEDTGQRDENGNAILCWRKVAAIEKTALQKLVDGNTPVA